MLIELSTEIFVGTMTKSQLILDLLDKEINFWPLVPQKLSVESSIKYEIHQKKVSSSKYVVELNQYIAKLVLDTALWARRKND